MLTVSRNYLWRTGMGFVTVFILLCFCMYTHNSQFQLNRMQYFYKYLCIRCLQSKQNTLYESKYLILATASTKVGS